MTSLNMPVCHFFENFRHLYINLVYIKFNLTAGRPMEIFVQLNIRKILDFDEKLEVN